MNETIKIKKHNVQHFIARELKYKNQWKYDMDLSATRHLRVS
jgi:hypothetical protein